MFQRPSPYVFADVLPVGDYAHARSTHMSHKTPVSMARWCKSWSGLVLCFIALHQQVSGADTPDVVAVFSDTAIAAAIDAAVAAQPAAIGVITAADLPKTRPP